MNEKELLIARLYDAVAAAFDEAGIVTLDMAPWREPVGYSVGPSTISLYFRLRHPVRDLPRALKLAAPIGMHVVPVLYPDARRAPQDFEVRVTQAGAFLEVDIPRADRQVLRIRDVIRGVERAFWLGQDVRGQPVAADLLALTAGVLVVGSSGTGKTNAIAWLAIQALVKGWAFYLVDLKGGQDWADLERYARMRAYTPSEADHVLAAVQELVAARNGRQAEPTPPVLLVFDELLLAPESQQKALARLSVVGRSARVRVLAGTQRLGNSVSSVVKQNLRYRLVGRVASRTEAYEATGVRASGAERLLGRGDMLWIADGPPVRVQTPHVLADHRLLPEALVYLRRAREPECARERGEDGEAAPAGSERDEAASDFETALQAMNSRHSLAKAVPPWLLARTVAYVQRYGTLPSFDLINRWHMEREGEQISVPRRRLVREWAVRLTDKV